MSVYLHFNPDCHQTSSLFRTTVDMLPSVFAEDAECHTKQEREDGWCQQ